MSMCVHVCLCKAQPHTVRIVHVHIKLSKVISCEQDQVRIDTSVTLIKMSRGIGFILVMFSSLPPEKQCSPDITIVTVNLAVSWGTGSMYHHMYICLHTHFYFGFMHNVV